MKIILFPALISFITLSLATACNSSSNAHIENISSTKANSHLNNKSKQIIEEYNSIILEYQNIDDDTYTSQKLKALIPKLKKINIKQERNKVLMNTYMRLGDVNQAYKLSEQILAKENKPNMKNFQRMLMGSLKKPNSLIRGCYSEAANLYKNELDKLQPSNSAYTQMLWSFNVNMYHAGNKNYSENLKKIVDDQKSETNKFYYKNLFEAETNISER